ncbi:MAG TPA: nucleoside-diphosphate sugar epimerase/dehydratase [Accumulibacter sp.]|uniref:polysaccharide biosynthesis protein n=1 Tax=Accumulibacter sp. TaxID=2053492 RepID=UPI000ECB998D|nr:nucleoside-diphosphate sugar epimerase/dehydratase [Accumulibacter sp.]HCZ16683.1 polysaccharide biosynthesis protein [Accumulibacter sp.]HRF72541.1 nucleoside-diphosphate sugar epimerase/dehydratase [Accumulibacter sp.]
MTRWRLPAGISSYLVLMTRPTKQGLMLLADALVLAFAVWAAYAVRLGEWFVPNRSQVLLMVVAPILAMPVFLKLGLYRSVIRYLGEQALWSVLKGMSLAALLWAVLAFMTQMTGLQGVPRAVPLLYWLIGFALVAGSRFGARWLLWLPTRSRFSGKQVLIYGAGDAGRQLAESLRRGRELFPAGFLDDDQALHGKDVGGLRVYPPAHLSTLLERFDIHDVIVTLPSVSSARRREVVAFLEHHPVRVRILPALTDIANGRHLVNMVREVDIGDLLGRDPVAADPTLLGRCITGKAVLVTGAGGSIGSELCRQIAALQPRSVILLEASEHALYQIHRVLQGVLGCELVPCLGSVGDAGLVSRLLVRHRIATIYHAAAHKHVPMVEANVLAGACNNVLGTLTLASAAFDAGVETFVLISTDKAVRPTNIMGASKRWAELVVQGFARQAAARGTGQRFCAVRFGNVLGSSGSVIPLFKEQIAQSGPVTVTHADVTRYFMSIHEAVQLVIQTGSLASGGEIFLLDMGDPVRIVDLARNMIRLAGYTVRDDDNPEGDIEIIITGLRPGEKLYEELLIASSNAVATSHPKIMKADEPSLDPEPLAALIEQLRAALRDRDEEAVRAMLMRVAGDPDCSPQTAAGAMQT